METKKILLVDDDEDERRLIKLFLKPFNFDIVEAVNGEEAVSLAAEIKPGLIIMDHRMPKLTGYEAIKKIQMNEKLKNTPIIMMTAQRFDSQMREIIKMDVLEFIPKPFDRNVFLEAIKKTMGISSAEYSKKIILATESMEIRAVMKTQLGDKYEITEVKTAEELTKKIELDKPDLIISTMNLLGWESNEGKRLLSQIVSSRIPLIVEVFSSRQDTAERSMLNTPNLFHINYFSVDDLKEHVEKLSR